MAKKFKPMKAATWKKGKDIPFPVLATPKIDGIRFEIKDGKAVTAQLKPIPNRKLRAWLEANLQEGLDGELKVPGKFNITSSVVMSHEHVDWKKVQPIVFDYVYRWAKGIPYNVRMENLRKLKNRSIVKLIPVLIHNMQELLVYEKRCLKAGHEGVMLRAIDSPYKYGRSSYKQFWLVKFVRMLSAEAKVVGFKQLLSNQNEAVENELGRMKRSSKKAGKVAKPLVGSFIGKVLNGKHKGKVIKAGGLKRVLQEDAFRNPKKYMSKVFTFEYKPYGELNLPRHTRFKAFRKGY